MSRGDGNHGEEYTTSSVQQISFLGRSLETLRQYPGMEPYRGSE